MILKSLISFLIICVVYTSYLIFLGPTWDTDKHKGHKNIISAEKYIYRINPCDKVMIGTSLSVDLHHVTLLKDFYNLSLFAKSPMDGLAIVAKSSHSPSAIYIESNHLFKDLDTNYLELLFDNKSYFLKKNFIILREENQPSGVFANHPTVVSIFSKTLSYYRRAVKKIKRMLSEKKEPQNQTPLEKDTVIEIVQHKINTFEFDRQLKSFSEAPSKIQTLARVGELKIYLTQLKNRGIKVVFYEMPFHEDLRNLPKMLALRRMLQTEFPSYTVIAPPKDHNYKTSDGAHLHSTGIEKYIQYLDREVRLER